MRSTDIVKTETDGRICAQKQLRGFPMPEYVAKYCNAMIGGVGAGKFRSRLQNSLLNKHWVDLPALKRDVCERLNANLCAEGEGLAPVPYAGDDVEPRCTYCQEMVSDAHFMVRRLRVEEWQRVAAFEYGSLLKRTVATTLVAAVLDRYATGPLSFGATSWIHGAKTERTAKKRRKNEQKWARYGLTKRVPFYA